MDGFRLAYCRHGSGPAVVLIHGSPGDHHEYDRLVPLLADHAELLVMDLRGFGRSSKLLDTPPRCYSRHGQARAIATLMDELHIREAVVVGYDIGGLIAQTLAAQRPDLVHALILAPAIPGGGARSLR